MWEPTALPPDAAAVLARWNPDGSSALSDLRAAGDRVSVAVVGSRAVERELSTYMQCVPSPTTASVVVVALDSAVPPGHDVLEVLATLPEGHPIVLAMDGVDVDARWDSARDRAHSLIGARIPRLRAAPIVPVSTRAGGDAGFPALVTAVTDAAAARGEQDRLAAATLTAGELALRRIRTKAADVRSSPDVTTLRAERVRIVGRRDGGRAEAAAVLRNQVQLARVDLVGDVGTRVRALHNTARADLEGLDAVGVGSYPERLKSAVVDVATGVDALVVARLEQVALTVAGTALREPLPPPVVDLGDSPQPRARGLEDRMMIFLGASAGLGLGRLAVAPLSLVPALEIATIPLTLLLGGLAAWWLSRSRAQVADRAHMRQWVSDVLMNVKAQLEQWVAASIVATEGELTERIVRASAARTAAVDAEIARLENELREAGARNSSQLAACERDHVALARGLAAVRDGTEQRGGASNTVTTIDHQEGG